MRFTRDGSYLSDVSMEELGTVIAAKNAATALDKQTKSLNFEHDSLIATREPRQTQSPLPGTLSVETPEVTVRWS